MLIIRFPSSSSSTKNRYLNKVIKRRQITRRSLLKGHRSSLNPQRDRCLTLCTLKTTEIIYFGLGWGKKLFFFDHVNTFNTTQQVTTRSRLGLHRDLTKIWMSESTHIQKNKTKLSLKKRGIIFVGKISLQRNQVCDSSFGSIVLSL